MEKIDKRETLKHIRDYFYNNRDSVNLRHILKNMVKETIMPLGYLPMESDVPSYYYRYQETPSVNWKSIGLPRPANQPSFYDLAYNKKISFDFRVDFIKSDFLESGRLLMVSANDYNKRNKIGHDQNSMPMNAARSDNILCFTVFYETGE